MSQCLRWKWGRFPHHFRIFFFGIYIYGNIYGKSMEISVFPIFFGKSMEISLVRTGKSSDDVGTHMHFPLLHPCSIYLRGYHRLSIPNRRYVNSSSKGQPSMVHGGISSRNTMVYGKTCWMTQNGWCWLEAAGTTNTEKVPVRCLGSETYIPISKTMLMLVCVVLFCLVVLCLVVSLLVWWSDCLIIWLFDCLFVCLFPSPLFLNKEFLTQ